MRQTEARGHATELAADAARDADALVVFSGDGTYNEAINGAAGRAAVRFPAGRRRERLPAGSRPATRPGRRSREDRRGARGRPDVVDRARTRQRPPLLLLGGHRVRRGGGPADRAPRARPRRAPGRECDVRRHGHRRADREPIPDGAPARGRRVRPGRGHLRGERPAVHLRSARCRSRSLAVRSSAQASTSSLRAHSPLPRPRGWRYAASEEPSATTRPYSRGMTSTASTFAATARFRFRWTARTSATSRGPLRVRPRRPGACFSSLRDPPRPPRSRAPSGRG